MPALLALAIAVQVGGMPAIPYRASDARIVQVAYDPDQVVPLAVGKGYAAVIDLGPDQQVDSVIVGNSEGWAVTASKRGDHVVVKQLDGATSTDMIVITAERRYVFLIQPTESSGAFVLSFAGQGSPAVPLTLSPAPPRQTTDGFRFSGAKSLFPADMHSDGGRTRVTWARTTPIPAIFAVEDGHEAIVNGRMVGNDYVIEGSASRYVFRLGSERAIATKRRKAAGR